MGWLSGWHSSWFASLWDWVGRSSRLSWWLRSWSRTFITASYVWLSLSLGGKSLCLGARSSSPSVALNPVFDDGTSTNDGAALKTGDCVCGASEVDVVEDQGTARLGDTLGVEGGDDTLGGVLDFAVENHDGADRLVESSVGHVQSHTAVIDGERLEGPGPVPVHEDGSVAVVEGQVACGELLVAEESTIVTAVEDKVGHEATGAVVHEDTNLLVGVSAALDHLEADVLQAGGLGNLPVDAGSLALVETGQIDDNIADATEEVVLVGVPVAAVVLVGIGVNDSDTLERRGSLDDGHVEGISHDLGIVVLDDRLGDDISARREVDKSRSSRGRVTALSTAASRGYGHIDSGRVIRAPITYPC